MLKLVLSANALFSCSTGIAMIACRSALSSHFPAPDWLWAELGVGLLMFATGLLMMVVRPALTGRFTVYVVLSDIAWVLFSVLALVVFKASISNFGEALIIAVNTIVGSLAWLQYLGLQRLHRPVGNPGSDPVMTD